LLARSLRWSHQVPGCVDDPVAAFTPARGGGGACRVRPVAAFARKAVLDAAGS